MKKLICWMSLSLAAWSQPTIEAGRIREHLRHLADDHFQGRGTGQPGGDEAAQYISQQFQSYGLEGGAPGGGFFQSVPLVGVTTLPSTKLILAGRTLKSGDEYVVINQTQQARVHFEAPIVFVGFGIDAPTEHWNDYKNLDLHGKVALLFVNEPESQEPAFFKGRALTYAGRWTYKYEETARRGAVATLIIHRTDLAAYGWEVVRNSGSAERSFLKRESEPALPAAAWIHYEVARELLSKEGLNLDQLYQAAQKPDFQPIALKSKLRLSLDSKLRPFSSRNVIARLPAGPEAVMYSAHYDHLGFHAGEKDPIYNGALDNASGCAILLELARVFAGTKTKRTLYFVSTTAEEQGLLGATYFAQHPPIPLKQISLDLNFDMVPPWGEPEEVTASGCERTTFGEAVLEEAGKLGMKLRPDPAPQAGLYYRMDHFSLAQGGVPGFSLGEGLKFRGQPEDFGIKLASEYTRNGYHHGADEFQPDWDFKGLAQFTQFAYNLGWRAANQEKMVQWLPGDEFEAARKKIL
ncbi:M28 family peptidase [bacterium]|nr:M28 family peptidase [bacterium]